MRNKAHQRISDRVINAPIQTGTPYKHRSANLICQQYPPTTQGPVCPNWHSKESKQGPECVLFYAFSIRVTFRMVVVSSTRRSLYLFDYTTVNFSARVAYSMEAKSDE